MLDKHKCLAKDIIELAKQYGSDKVSVSLANSTSFTDFKFVSEIFLLLQVITVKT